MGLSLEKSWEKGLHPCPSCGKMVELGALRPLEMNSCPHCGAPFFAPKRIGAYWLVEPAGGGGMGSVYKAVSEKYPQRLLAVKVLARIGREAPGNIHALLNEVTIGSRLTGCDGVAACIDGGYEDDEYFTVMPFVQGERLDERLEREGKLPPEEALPLALHLIAAEQFIYNHGYLYRDMKPENVIITPQGHAVLIDFGLCVSREKALNPSAEFVEGSPYYLPPERLLGEPEDVCSEIYSLGMVLYHVLNGATYYDSGELEALARRHVGKLRIASSSKMQAIRPDIAAVLTEMLRQEPADRPQSFHEVYEALAALIISK